MGAATVRLYTHRGCPGGEAARRYLEEHGIPYRVYDVVRDPEAQAEFRRLGGVGTPLLVVGRQVMHGFDPEEYERIAAAMKRGGSVGG